MNRKLKIQSGIVLVLCFLFTFRLTYSQERYFDSAEQKSEQIRLNILYPSMGSIRALMELGNIGFIPIENLLVIGVFHEMEMTNYQNSIDYAMENSLDWLKFHRLSGELNKDIIFQQNDLTDEFENIFKKSDGIIFFGGADIPPYIYHEKTHLLTDIDKPYRNLLEVSFIFHLLGGHQEKEFTPLLDCAPDFPILGICLGCQSLNVGTGGTLIQDIWIKKYGKKTLEDVISLGKDRWHTNPYRRLYPEQNLISYNMHPIKLLEKGKFVREFGFIKEDKPYIVSAHHQMAGKLGKGMKVIATSLDGKVVEALEHENYPNVLGVQFHPEFPILYDRTRTYRFTPQDTEEISLLEILEKNPPSYQFHEKIWEWFSEKLTEYHNSQK
ncbi:MAG: gamma-glutamyl-gamma-aminobutyrate hydrolase family protein [bacterium]|nr:MAG: gamma-glutamyl-gamma-aminobutyrate hydrolase family protein [bacterium]